MRGYSQYVAAIAAAALMGCGGPADSGSTYGRSSVENALKNGNGSTGTVTYSGQGLTADGAGGYDLDTEVCGVENGAEQEGAYILWVFTAAGATSATITGPWGTAAMTKYGNGTFKYISRWYDLAGLLGNVTATITDGSANNPQLVISHGCRPVTKKGAWCSPGFWRNARPGAWDLVDVDPGTAMFNGTVATGFYGEELGTDQPLTAILADPQTYSGKAVQGTAVSCELNAFNATGAYLTNLLPGFEFSCTVMQTGGEDACPIDNFGNRK